MRRRLASLARHLTGLVRLDREGDRVLAAFPKSGSTWVRFVLCNLVSLRYWDGRPLDFPLLDRTMPELGVTSLAPGWDYGDLLPRVVKTHRSAWPVLREVPALLLVRDPRDVMVSFFHHDAAQGGPRNPGDTLSTFLRGRRWGVPAWIRHTASWRDAGATVVRYEDLKADPRAGFRRVVEALGARIPDALLSEAVERSTLEATRAAEERGGLDPDKGFDDSFRFVRKGAVGEGRQVLSDEDRAWIAARLSRAGIDLYG